MTGARNSEHAAAERLCHGCRHLSRERNYPLPFCLHPQITKERPKGLHLPIAVKKFCGHSRNFKEASRR